MASSAGVFSLPFSLNCAEALRAKLPILHHGADFVEGSKTWFRRTWPVKKECGLVFLCLFWTSPQHFTLFATFPHHDCGQADHTGGQGRSHIRLIFSTTVIILL